MTKREGRLIDLLKEAKLQIEYLHGKFQPTGSGEAVLWSIEQELKEKWGCHCDLEEGQEPDGCVIDEGRPSECFFAQRLLNAGKGRDDCEEWRQY